MFLMIDISGTGLAGADFAWRLFREAGVSVLEASAFGQSGAGYVRLSYTLGEDALLEGCRRIKRFVEGLGKDDYGRSVTTRKTPLPLVGRSLGEG
jgi:arginine:pyruvate transaminase